MRRTNEFIENDYFCFGIKLTHIITYSKREGPHLQCLLIANSSSLGSCGSPCFHSHPFLLNLCRSSSVPASSRITSDEAPPPSLVLFSMAGPTVHSCSLVQGPKSPGQTCAACALCCTAASKSLASFLSGVKSNFQLKFKLKKISPEAHSSWEDTWSLELSM